METLKIFTSLWLLTGILLLVSACGGGGGGEAPSPPASTYTVTVMVNGLVDSLEQLELQNNDDNLTISTNGNYTFATALSTGESYSIAVIKQPVNPWQTCTVTNASGSIDNNNISDVRVDCVVNILSVDMTVTGLTGTGLILQNNNTDDLAIDADGSFSYSVASGESYQISVLTQPGNPAQTCRIDNPGGMVANSNINNISVTCTDNYTALQISGSCSLLESNQIKCWGSNTYGQLGLGDTDNRGAAPDQMGDFLPTIDLGNPSRSVLQVTKSSVHTCALSDNGRVKCWGRNDDGQLGLGDTTYRGIVSDQMGINLPAVDLGAGRTAVQITVGGAHSCALLDDGTIKCWGDNFHGQLGTGDEINHGIDINQMGEDLPVVNLGTGRSAVSISAGSKHTCAILDDASLKCWGLNQSGQLGLGSILSEYGNRAADMGDNLPVVDLGTGRTALQVSAGNNYTCAVLDNNSVKCWGWNGQGRLGLGDENDRGSLPEQMGDNLPAVDLGSIQVGPTIAIPIHAQQVSAGYDHTCALTTFNNVKCWGDNGSGELGLGDINDRGITPEQMGNALSPVPLGNGRFVQQVDVNINYTCALLDTNEIKCWGYNPAGSLGLGDTRNRGGDLSQMGDNLPIVDLGAP